MKKLISLFLCLAFLMGMIPMLDTPVHAAFDVWDGSVANEFAGGSGTATDPYQIKTAAQLAYLAVKVSTSTYSYLSGYYSLLADLDLNGLPWTPIGGGETGKRFDGTFIGNGHTIKNLHIDDPSSDYIGLFGRGSGISGVTLQDAFVRGNQYVGALVGSGSASQCIVTGTVYGYERVGGVIGYGADTIRDCYNCATVTGSGSDIGGIVGYIHSEQITCCVNDGKVTSTGGSCVGGIAGYGSYSKISDCLNRGEITGTDNVVGIAYYPKSVINCGNTGTVTSSGDAGGIATYLVSGTITNCFNAGMVTGKNGFLVYTGGIAGEAQTTAFTNCWNLSGTADLLIGETPTSGFENTLSNVVTVDSMNTQEFLDLLNENLDPYMNTLWARNPRAYDGLPYLPLEIDPLPEEAYIPLITAEATAREILIRWDAVDGVTKYALYKRAYENGAWGTWQTLSTTLNGTNYIDRDGVYGIKYQYRMKGYHGSWSSYSNTVSSTLEPPSPLSITDIAADKTGTQTGKTITWSASAIGGSGTLKYCFNIYKDGTMIQKGSYKTVQSVSYTPLEAGTYKVRLYVKDALGTKVNKLSGEVEVTGAAVTKPAITTQPTSETSAIGAEVTFQVEASGMGLNYQWQYSKNGGSTWYNKSGATSSSYSVTAKASYDGILYRCKVSNLAGNVYSSGAKLTVIPKPVITAQPASRIVTSGETVTFQTAASGTGLSYQWQYSKNGGSTWYNKSGATASSYTLTAKASYDGMLYRCKVKNVSGSVYTSSAKLTVIAVPKPIITTQPTSRTVAAGSTATFKVAATGTGLTYQWQYSKDGGTTWYNKSGATAASCSVTAKASYSGILYRCKVKNAGGTVYTSGAKLTVN